MFQQIFPHKIENIEMKNLSSIPEVLQGIHNRLYEEHNFVHNPMDLELVEDNFELPNHVHCNQ